MLSLKECSWLSELASQIYLIGYTTISALETTASKPYDGLGLAMWVCFKYKYTNWIAL